MSHALLLTIGILLAPGLAHAKTSLEGDAPDPRLQKLQQQHRSWSAKVQAACKDEIRKYCFGKKTNECLQAIARAPTPKQSLSDKCKRAVGPLK